MVWKFCEIWNLMGIPLSEGPNSAEILSHSVSFGMYVVLFQRIESLTNDYCKSFPIKHMFLVRKRNVSGRRFFYAPKACFIEKYSNAHK